MTENKAWRASRKITKHVYVSGKLVLLTPAHFGNGDSEAITDIPLLMDSLDEKRPLLTGTSIAGALRNYLRECEGGFGVEEEKNGTLLSEKLFGHLVKENDKEVGSKYSWLNVDDALGEFPAQGVPVEIRDGVAIDVKTRTAELNEHDQGQKFDIELLSAGTTFEVNFELLLTENNDELLAALAMALKGLEDGKIGLGMRKRRGYGECRVNEWYVASYRMDDIDDVLGWLEHEDYEKDFMQEGILSLLGASPETEFKGEALEVEAKLRLQDSLLIRSNGMLAEGIETAGVTGEAADAVHLRSQRQGTDQPVISGTSLAGVLRSRAFRIAKTMKDETFARDMTDRIFGGRIRSRKDKNRASGSRLVVWESLVHDAIQDRIQNRVKIDRFTGGAYPGALFSEQPLFAVAGNSTCFTLRMALRKSAGMNQTDFDAEVGLILLVLKDLCTGDLPVGGGSSVGRGRLHGEWLKLSLNEKQWEIREADGKLDFTGDDPDDLEDVYLNTFLEACDEA